MHNRKVSVLAGGGVRGLVELQRGKVNGVLLELGWLNDGTKGQRLWPRARAGDAAGELPAGQPARALGQPACVQQSWLPHP